MRRRLRTEKGCGAGKKAAPSFIAIVGGSGAGKSWLARQLKSALHPHALSISLDDFYRDRSSVAPANRSRINFDHPRAIDWAVLDSVLLDWQAGRPARVPGYDFSTHCRLSRARTIRPKRFILIEGLWLLRRPALRRLFACRIFIECPKSARLSRRLARDRISRGRRPAAVRHQFVSMVDPMHCRFVEPQKRWANLILPHDISRRQVQPLAAWLKALGLQQDGSVSEAGGGQAALKTEDKFRSTQRGKGASTGDLSRKHADGNHR